MNIRFIINRLLLNIQLNVGKLRLLGYAILLDAVLSIGDITIFFALPEYFIGALIISILIVSIKKMSPIIYRIILKRRILLTTALVMCSCIIFINYFVWISPY